MTEQAIKRRGDLEIDENPKLQNATWTIERVAWVVMALLVLAGLAGAFGHGPLSRSEARTPDGALTVEYPRITRLDAADELELRFRPGGSGTATVEIDGSFSSNFVVERAQPEPTAQRTHEGGMSLDFEVAPGVREQVVVMHVRPRRPAFPARATVGLRGETPVEIAAVVFP